MAKKGTTTKSFSEAEQKQMPEQQITPQQAGPGLDLVKIKISDTLNTDYNFFDVRIPIDISDDDIRNLKAYTLPVDIACLMPYQWDALPFEVQRERMPATYLGADKFFEDAKYADNREEVLKNLRIIGRGMQVNSYQAVEQVLRVKKLSGAPLFDPTKLSPFDEDKPLGIKPYKLFISLLEYDKIAVDLPEEKDMLARILDKVALSVVLPYIIEGKLWSPLPQPPYTQEQLDAFDNDLLQKLKALDIMQGPVENEIFEDKHDIMLEKEEWKALLGYTAGPSREDLDKFLIPIDMLDEVLTEHLQTRFKELKGSNNQFKTDVESESFVGFANPEASAMRRRTDYGFFYPIVDRFLAEERQLSSLELLKLRYKPDAASNLLPYIEEIDLRPMQWNRQASLLSTEIHIAAKRYALVKKEFEAMSAKAGASLEDIEAVSNRLRMVTMEWFDVKQQFEILREKVKRAGYDLTYMDAGDGLTQENLGKLYTLSQKYIQTRVVKILKQELERWTETFTVRHCKRFFIKLCWNQLVRQERSRWRSWYETRVHQEYIDKAVAVDYDPIDTYLELGVPVNSMDGEDKITEGEKLAVSLKLKVTAPVATEENGQRFTSIRNRNKEVHIFSFANGEYRDQNGVLLQTLLNRLERIRTDKKDRVSARAKQLFIIPKVERNIAGNVVIEKYFAVHNPVAGRTTNIFPNFYFVETYRHAFGQVPGHWLGALSHTVTLLPGESRRLKLVTESRLESKQIQESRSSQKTASSRKANVRDQVRKELENSSQSSSTSNWSANASGGLNMGIWSASGGGSAGGSRSKSSASVAKSLNDHVSEVMNEVSSSNEIQFVSTSETNSEFKSSEESIIEFKNVNQGRSINYKFFQILHQYRSVVLLDKVRIVVEYGHEVIPGIDIVITKVFSLDELEEIMPELIEGDRQRLIKNIQTKILERYSSDKLAEDKKNIKPDIEIDSKSCFVNSGSYFVDNEVSLLPATEDYVERAREAEIEAQVERTNRIRAEAKAIEAGKWTTYESLPGGYKMGSEGIPSPVKEMIMQAQESAQPNDHAIN